jgi:toxin ParE1/3/4
MTVIFHRLFQKDLSAALRYYDEAGGSPLGDRFFGEVEAALKRVAANPRRYHYISETMRRAPLRRFPYHIIFEESPARLKFLILRHDKRHPSFGMRRQ